MMKRLQNRINLAKKELGRSVIAINPNVYKEAASKHHYALFCGIKDTNQIPDDVINRLRLHENIVWLTVDKGADKGRAIDTDLHNPITYRLMTGSTSGGPINILKGINDVAVGTDGGGSVLAPAMSCQLPSAIGAGLGLDVKRIKCSTDGMKFVGSVGVIAKNIATLTKTMECLIEDRLTSEIDKEINMVIPKKGSVTCPDQKDMSEKVMEYLSKIDYSEYTLEELDMTGIHERKKGIELIQHVFEEKKADVIVTYEGPIDVYGYGETIPQYFGKVGRAIAKDHGKFLVRSANMCNTTAITVPAEDLASGLVIIAKKGIENARSAFRLAEKLEKEIRLPDVWSRYFLADQQYDGFDTGQV